MTRPTLDREGTTRSTSRTIKAGIVGGLVGAVCIWFYEALVWVGIERMLPLAGIPRNATGLVFGKPAQTQLGAAAYLIGTIIHSTFAILWGVVFAALGRGCGDA